MKEMCKGATKLLIDKEFSKGEAKSAHTNKQKWSGRNFRDIKGRSSHHRFKNLEDKVSRERHKAISMNSHYGSFVLKILSLN